MSVSHASLSRLFAPGTIAVVGASASPEKPGYQMMKSLEAFAGAVYPVNPNAGEILGHTAYPDLASLPGPVDLVALVVPPGASPAILRQAADMGAGAVLMVSGGFAETGEQGQRLQEEVAGICRDGRMRLLGPNTSGFINPVAGLNASFLPPLSAVRAGNIGLVAQSGGINITTAFLAHAEGLGLSLGVGLGNAPDVGLVDVIDYLATDEATAAIAVHLEGVADGRALFEAVRRTARVKPVVALPVGRADLGGFAESHTGNLIGSFGLTRAALEQAGAVVVDTTGDFVDAAHVLSKCRLPPNPDPGIGILTGQAGPGLLIVDTLRAGGVSVPEASPRTTERIANLLPPMTFMRNPVDTGRPLGSFGQVLKTLADDGAMQALLVYALLEEDAVDPIEHVGVTAGEISKPVVYSTCGLREDIRPIMQALEDRGVACYDSPDRAARAVRALAYDARAAWRRICEPFPVASSGPSRLGPGPLDEDAAKQLVERSGLAVPRRAVCNSRPEARAALAALGPPVVVKVLDATITHKTEVGGVQVGIESRADLDRTLDAIDAIPGTGGRRGYLVEAMAPPGGVEIIIGGTNDPGYGPTVLLGLGGVAAEALGDVALRLAPIGPTEAASMIDELKGRALLDGWRGAPAADRGAIADALVKISALMVAYPDIVELDLNPVRVYADGLLALDALILTRS